MTRPLLAATACLLALAACTAGNDAPTAAQPAAEVSLHQSDVPTGLSRCPASGAIDAYLRAIRTPSPSAWRDLSNSWRAARSAGADSAEVVVYADTTTACTSGLLAPAGRSAASVAIRYPNSEAANAAWKHGILDLPPPAPDQQSPGLTSGVATGLGRFSWSYDRSAVGRPSYLAFWQNGTFDILAAAAGLSPEESRLAAGQVSGRVR